MKSALEMTHEITKLVKYSPRRESIFRDLKGEMAPSNPGVRVLCPTRWTVRADSMQSIIQNYSVLQELWDKAVEIVHDSDTIACIRGVTAQMQSFDFLPRVHAQGGKVISHVVVVVVVSTEITISRGLGT